MEPSSVQSPNVLPDGSSVVLSYQDRVVQVLHQEIHVDPVGYGALADILETFYRAYNYQSYRTTGTAGRIDRRHRISGCLLLHS